MSRRPQTRPMQRFAQYLQSSFRLPHLFGLVVRGGDVVKEFQVDKYTAEDSGVKHGAQDVV